MAKWVWASQGRVSKLIVLTLVYYMIHCVAFKIHLKRVSKKNLLFLPLASWLIAEVSEVASEMPWVVL